ncbi:MAG: nucleotide pyrophosphohydrolase [Anaerolineaceae bacterium]|nr:nucleotide pyrophosphohydrolase [Anaerolineaceae bacterium]
MDIKTLEDAMHAFVERKGWYKPDSPHPQTPKNLAVSLVIEASEVLELYQWGEQADPEQLSGELADVLLYLLQLASLNQIDLGQAVMDKLRVNHDRSWE